MSEDGAEQRALFSRWPAGVSVVAAEHESRRAGLTVSSLVSLSLTPPLVGISLATSASLFEVIRGAGSWGVSLLTGEQAQLAQHFARSVPPIVQWDGIEVREHDARLLVGALGWLLVQTVDEIAVGDHVIFVGQIEWIEEGTAKPALVYVDHRYESL